MAWQAAMLRENLTYLGLDGYDMQEAVQRLRMMPATEIVRALPMVQHWSATLDGSFLGGLQSSDLQVANTWCNSILIGDMAHDVRLARLLPDGKTLNSDEVITGHNLAVRLLGRSECEGENHHGLRGYPWTHCHQADSGSILPGRR